MKVAFVSNYLQHHQIPVCEVLVQRLGDGFHFIQSQKPPEEYLKNGYDLHENEPYQINSYQSEAAYQKAFDVCMECDVLIHTYFTEQVVKERLRQGKLTFRYSERILKKGLLRALDPRIVRFVYSQHTQYRDQNLHLLCASAYMAGDMKLFHAYPGKVWKWGYFPPAVPYSWEDLAAKKKKHVPRLLWTGRFLKWKHPDDALVTAARLREAGFVFTMEMVGGGPQEKLLRALCSRLRLDDIVTFPGLLPHEKVREHMEEADIFLFTSDYQEGWGAVVNEAMNSGCALVASHAAGSVPFLIQQGKNGLIYKSGDADELFRQTARLLSDSQLTQSLGRAALETATGPWSAKRAAEQFLRLSEALLRGETPDIPTGPCSPAPYVGQSEIYRMCMKGTM